MLGPLRPWFPAIEALLLGLKNKGPATWLHQYTHGGTPQLLRRGPGWIGKDVYYTLMMSDLFALIAACHETLIAPNAELSAYAFPRRDELGAEAWAFLKLPGPVPVQPHELPALPATANDGCGPPMGV